MTIETELKSYYYDSYYVELEYDEDNDVAIVQQGASYYIEDDYEDISGYRNVFYIYGMGIGQITIKLRLYKDDPENVVKELPVTITVGDAVTTAASSETTAVTTTASATAAVKTSPAKTTVTTTVKTTKATKTSKTTVNTSAETVASKTTASAKTSKTTASETTAKPKTSLTAVQTTKVYVTTPVLKEGAYGECGENVMWALDESREELVIFGEGDMYDYESYNEEWANLYTKIKSIKVTEGITYIGNYAFSILTDADRFELPSTLEAIGDCAFRATGAEKITIPDNVTAMGKNVFTMSIVKNVKLPGGMNKIPSGTFEDCRSLESVEIPESITEIGAGAFANCASLKSFTIPEYITKIDINAFLYCDNLSDIYIENPDCIIEQSEDLATLGNVNTLIHGYLESTAYKYAEKNGNRFISLEDGTVHDPGRVKGDANGDHKLSVRDSAYIAKMLAQGRAVELPVCADFNEDNKVNVRDAAAIAKYLAAGKV